MGVLNGKHIVIQKPHNSGSEYFNYKGYFNILLFAHVSHDYQFLHVDVGVTARNGDAGIFENSTLKKKMVNWTIGFSDPEELQGTGFLCNYNLIGDDAVPLRPDIMKPFPFRQLNQEQHVFNYRLSRARSVVENAFGILANRFRVFLTKIALPPCKVAIVVLASCCLHNMLIVEQPTYLPTMIAQDSDNHKAVNGQWREDSQLENMAKTQKRNCSTHAKNQRQMLKTYFNSASWFVPWQSEMVFLK